MKALTERQALVLSVIKKSIKDRGYPPTLREIDQKLGIRSTNGVNDHMRALETKGYITRADKTSRGISLTDREAIVAPASEDRSFSERLEDIARQLQTLVSEMGAT